MGARPSSRRSHVILGWVALGLALATLQTIWSVSIPPMASPDEPSHVVHAAAVVRGQWSGVVGPAPATAMGQGSVTTVRLPADYAAASALPDCFAHHSNQPASCQAAVPPPGGTTVAVDTYAGQYPPLYYLLVGWPSRFLHAVPAMYAMRLVTDLLTSVLLVWGLYRLRTVTSRAAWTWAALAALTPMTLFVGAMVNPQALEIASAFAFWAACLALVRSPDGPRRSVVVQAAVTGALLVNTRMSGPVWALAIVAVALVLAPKGRLRILWRLRSIRWALVVAVAAGLAAAAWVVTHGAIASGTHSYPEFASPLRAGWFELAQTSEHLQQMIGNYGWLDAPSPALTVLVWSVLVGALLLLAVAAASRRTRAALLLAALAVVVVPVALQIPTAVDTGLIWQGRYTLPAAVGVPMVAAIALDGAPAALEEIVRRMVRWAAVPSVAVAHVAAFWWAMRRYAVGIDGRFLTRAPDWSSPLGYLSAVAVYAVPVALLAAAAARSLPTTRDGESEPGLRRTA